MKWPKKLVVVRHGLSELNVAKDLLEKDLAHTLHLLKNKRDVDICLTETGIMQAQKTGKFLSAYEKFDACYVSPYKRCIDTAKNIISNFDYGLETHKDNRLREKEFGKLHGLEKEEIAKLYPDEHECRIRDGKYWYRLPGGENYPDVEMRIHSFLGKLNRDHQGHNILVVTHHVPCAMFRALFEHLDEDGVLALGDVANCGIVEFDIDFKEEKDGKMKLKHFNKVVY